MLIDNNRHQSRVIDNKWLLKLAFFFLALRIKNGQMKEAVEYSVNILPARM
jgi:hypothetical protein